MEEDLKILSDEELLSKCVLGSESHFRELIIRYEQKVRGYCSYYLNDPSLAEDLAQEVFLRVFRFSKNFKFKSKVSTWIFSITSNVCRDAYRKKKSFLSILADMKMLNFSNDSNNIYPSIEKSFANQEIAKDILLKLGKLEREVLLMHYYLGFSYDELAEMNKVSLDSIKSRVKRAKKIALNYLAGLEKDGR